MSLLPIAIRRNRPKRNIALINLGTGINNLAIAKNGRLWSWGSNTFGEYGDNTIIGKLTPVSVAGTVKTFCKISAGNNVSCAIDKNGRAWTWGTNNNGQLGDNTVVNKSTPISVAGTVKTFCEIEISDCCLALDKNGRAWAWGINSFGVLGDNTVVNKSTPVSVAGTVKTFCKISVATNSLAIDKNGRLWAWGANEYGQLGDNTVVNKSTPVSVAGIVKTFCKIETNSNTCLAIDKNGRAWAWGNNLGGQLGDNTVVSKSTPVSVAGAVKTFCEITCGSLFSAAIDKNGKIWTWGVNNNATLGNDSAEPSMTPVSIRGNAKTFCKVYAGNRFSIALDKNGGVWAWGDNITGVLGIKQSASYSTPVSVVAKEKTFCNIKGSTSFFSLAIDKNGKVFTWGVNNNGRLGNNSTVPVISPKCICGAVKTFCEIAGGNAFSAAIDKNGRAWAWGSNIAGQLGDNTVVSKSTPVSVAGTVKTFCKIGCMTTSVLAIDKNGRAWAWGSNSAGQLGDGTIISKSTPVSVAGAIKTFCQIGCTTTSVLAIDKNGRAWAWGSNFYGQLGDNSVVDKSTPVSVAGTVKTFCKIGNIGLANHSLAIDKNGRAWAWGFNSSGQLGDNSIVNKSTPVSVAGTVKTFCEISAGNTHSLAIDKNGIVWAWGSNANGRLGDGTFTSRSTPVSVAGATKTFCRITAGTVYSLAIDKNGKAWAWGPNNQSGGVMGYYLGTAVPCTPVRVYNI